ncbi:hypothetical protein [Alkalihalobacterium chitinilyticum]|uniref:Uncharacterized protein n=1 Tax=Alkalihalobacterium chitinilyticum TaxID=2980103 RepID=A0ABT5V8P2_9BACI|nr:hypothetical protein [Alkalihalobacterium chitinilyticum]MDE5411834.1 hypothetical protein [Alkalihalobacterium chitinilyticum]
MSYNHDIDYDRDGDREDELTETQIVNLLKSSLQQEEEMLKTYTILAERIHDNDVLKNRLENFAQGNAKRSRQLEEEIKQNEESH